jgi:NAD(P)-dependent dehydrogenase (short-subunit alcohol dehydrogenase family)
MEKAAAEVVAVFGKAYVLVNTAGVVIGPSIDTATYDDWDFEMGVNVIAVFNGVHAFLPHIRSHGDRGADHDDVLHCGTGGANRGNHLVQPRRLR